MSNWKTLQNDKEKYQAYLCSREWSERKEAVHSRSSGWCERRLEFVAGYEQRRCPLPGNAVHHLTYANKYNEPIEDLIHYCNACHDFTHAKSTFDPLTYIRWCRYLTACFMPDYPRAPWMYIENEEIRATPVSSVIAFFGARSMEGLESILAASDDAYSMIVIWERVWSSIPSIEINGAEDGQEYDLGVILESAIYTLQNALGLKFNLADWLCWGAPEIDHQLYQESISQVRKCLHKLRRKETARDV